MAKTSLLTLADRLRTEGDAYVVLEEMRWGDEPVCAHCGSVRRHYFLNPENGKSRKTRTGAASERRVWKCADCRKQISATTNTIFHRSKVPLRIWLLVIYDCCACKNGISAREVERKYGLTAKTAWFMMHRLREAMKREPMAGLLSGRVVADETWYGGKAKNRHGYGSGQRPPGAHDKTPIMSLVSRETGEVRSRVVPNVRRHNLSAVLHSEVNAAQTHLHTDAGLQYRKLGQEFGAHSYVDHDSKEWARGDVSTNQAEAYFSQLKRSLDGTHHHVSREHLDRYLAEFDFRYSTRKLTDIERIDQLVSQTGGRRLMYREPGAGYGAS